MLNLSHKEKCVVKCKLGFKMSKMLVIDSFQASKGGVPSKQAKPLKP